jgi:hypothetical protein
LIFLDGLKSVITKYPEYIQDKTAITIRHFINMINFKNIDLDNVIAHTEAQDGIYNNYAGIELLPMLYDDKSGMIGLSKLTQDAKNAGYTVDDIITTGIPCIVIYPR